MRCMLILSNRRRQSPLHRKTDRLAAVLRSVRLHDHAPYDHAALSPGVATAGAERDDERMDGSSPCGPPIARLATFTPRAAVPAPRDLDRRGTASATAIRQ